MASFVPEHKFTKENYSCSKCENKAESSKLLYEFSQYLHSKPLCRSCLDSETKWQATPLAEAEALCSPAELSNIRHYVLGICMALGVPISGAIALNAIPASALVYMWQNLRDRMLFILHDKAFRCDVVIDAEIVSAFNKLISGDLSLSNLSYSQVQSFRRGIIDAFTRPKQGVVCVTLPATISGVFQTPPSAQYDFKEPIDDISYCSMLYRANALIDLLEPLYTPAMQMANYTEIMSKVPAEAKKSYADAALELQAREGFLNSNYSEQFFEDQGHLEFYFIREPIDGVLPPMPAKAHATDSGYDLTLMKRVKRIVHGPPEAPYCVYEMYDTGIIVIPPGGYIVGIYPRSSIYKTGYSLANSVGVIDRTYRGHLMVMLKKEYNLVDETPLPQGTILAQAVLMHSPNSIALEAHDFTSTARGAGGFGSTDAKKPAPSPDSVVVIEQRDGSKQVLTGTAAGAVLPGLTTSDSSQSIATGTAAGVMLPGLTTPNSLQSVAAGTSEFPGLTTSDSSQATS